MKEENQQQQKKADDVKKKKDDKDLPYCVTAPSAEHARAANEDEPCDDGRAGGSE